MYVAVAILVLSGCENKKGAFLETVETNNTVPVAVEKFIKILKEKKLRHLKPSIMPKMQKMQASE